MQQLLLSFTVISDFYRYFIPNKTILFSKFQSSQAALKSTE